MAQSNRPLSPHLQVYVWGVHMLVSILHRATGFALAVGSLILVWWLVVLAQNDQAYFDFAAGLLSSLLGRLVLFGVTFALMQHLASGIRHLIMDTGALFDLSSNKASATFTLVFSTITTILIWVAAYSVLGAL